MKKLILLFLVILLTGCMRLDTSNYEEIINNSIKEDSGLDNEYRSGYKYYLPKDMKILSNKEYNEKLSRGDTYYYLFVDIVSYYNKVKSEYKVNENAFYSKAINHDDYFGYLEINVKNNKYFIEMMYNYAKIEVIVDEVDIKNTIQNSITILSSIQYNNKIIDNIMGDNVLNFSEKDFDIFETKKESSYNTWLEKYDKYEEQNEEEIPDLDVIDKGRE